QQKIFHRRFVRALLAFRKSDEHVEGKRHQLKTDIERDEIVAAGEEHHAHGRKQNERVVFAVLLAFYIQIAHGDADGQRSTYQEDALEKYREAVNPQHAVKAVERK